MKENQRSRLEVREEQMKGSEACYNFYTHTASATSRPTPPRSPPPPHSRSPRYLPRRSSLSPASPSSAARTCVEGRPGCRQSSASWQRWRRGQAVVQAAPRQLRWPRDRWVGGLRSLLPSVSIEQMIEMRKESDQRRMAEEKEEGKKQKTHEEPPSLSSRSSKGVRVAGLVQVRLHDNEDIKQGQFSCSL